MLLVLLSFQNEFKMSINRIAFTINKLHNNLANQEIKKFSICRIQKYSMLPVTDFYEVSIKIFCIRAYRIYYMV